MSSNSVCNHRLVINKSDSRCAVVRFCYHSYDYRPNWTPLSPITITNCLNNKMLEHDWLLRALVCNGNRTEWSTIEGVIERVI